VSSFSNNTSTPLLSSNIFADLSVFSYLAFSGAVKDRLDMYRIVIDNTICWGVSRFLVYW
jgi:hypothetical protein